MRTTFLLILLSLGTMLSAQTFRWNNPNTQAKTVDSPVADQVGFAVYYADYYEGNPTALGETYHHNLMTAAHAKLPLGTIVKVTRIDNGMSTTVRINDRGAYCDGCVIDLSRAAAQAIDLLQVGKSRVQLTVMGFSNTNPQRVNIAAPPSTQNQWATRGGVSNNNVAYDSRPSTYEAPTPVQLTPKSTVSNTSYTAPASSNNTIAAPAASADEVKLLTNRIEGYGVQLGSYRDFGNAERHVVSLQRKGFNSLYVLQESRSDGSTINRVIVTPFTSITSAENYLADLQQYHQMAGLVVKMR